MAEAGKITWPLAMLLCASRAQDLRVFARAIRTHTQFRRGALYASPPPQPSANQTDQPARERVSVCLSASVILIRQR